MDLDEQVTVQMGALPILKAAAASIIGTREYQQDAYAYVVTDQGCLAVICDGMGGMEHGEIASRSAVKNIIEGFENWEGGSIPDFLVDAAVEMDRVVADLVDSEGNKVEGGTTGIAVIVNNGQMHWMSVGDSRIYIMRDREMLCVTQDHNYGYELNQKFKRGDITYDEYCIEQAQAEALISYFGMGRLAMLDVNNIPFQLVAGDKILMCSDGLYKCLSNEQIRRVLWDNSHSVKDTLEQLIAEVENADKIHKDNTTVILMVYE